MDNSMDYMMEDTVDMDNENGLLQLPVELQINILVRMPFWDLLRLCRTNKYFHEICTRDDILWRRRIEYWFDSKYINPEGNNRKIYFRLEASKILPIFYENNKLDDALIYDNDSLYKILSSVINLLKAQNFIVNNYTINLLDKNGNLISKYRINDIINNGQIRIYLRTIRINDPVGSSNVTLRNVDRLVITNNNDNLYNRPKPGFLLRNQRYGKNLY